MMAFVGRKDFLGRSQAIQRRRKTGVDRHLHDDFDHLVARHPDVQRALNMYLELRRCIAQRGERGDYRNLAALQIKARARIDVAERKLDQLAREVRRDVAQAVDDAHTGVTVDFPQFCETLFVAAWKH